MTRATISTGNLTFSVQGPDSGSNSPTSKTCHILIMANFSGQLSGSAVATDSNDSQSGQKTPLSKRKLISIDRDNFEDVFCSLNVRCQLPFSEQALSFASLDDMHPDYLYENLPLFEHFKTLKRKLKSSAKFEEAAAEIYQWHESQTANERPNAEKSASKVTEHKSELTVTNSESFLDELLTNQNTATPSDQFNIAGLIKDVIAPYVEPKANPQQKELLKTVDQATSELMRKLMHHARFQSLESAWRSLYLLVKRIETDQNLKLFIVDVSEQELMQDALLSDTLLDSQLHKLLVSNRESIGSIPFSLIMHDAVYGNNLVDINALNHLSEVAATCNAALVVGGTEKLAGCENLQQTPDKDDWHYQTPTEILEAWNVFRSSAPASGVIAVSPRYLSRMPYGKRMNPIDSFDYEELTERQRHRFYLWSNGAWLIPLIAAQSFTQTGVAFSGKIQQVDQLSLHVYEEDGESVVTPCAEIHMTDSTSLALRSVGLTSIRSIINKDSVAIPNIAAVAL